MAARFPALGNNDIDATVHSSFSVGGRADCMQHDCSTRLRARHQGGRVTPEKRNHRHALVEASRKALFLRELEVQVHAKRP
jgi:hypothetical protein